MDKSGHAAGGARSRRRLSCQADDLAKQLCIFSFVSKTLVDLAQVEDPGGSVFCDAVESLKKSTQQLVTRPQCDPEQKKQWTASFPPREPATLGEEVHAAARKDTAYESGIQPEIEERGYKRLVGQVS